MNIETYFTQINAPSFISAKFENDEWWLLTGKFISLLIQNTKSQKLEELEAIYPGVYFESSGDPEVQIYIGKGVKIAPTTVIQGPCWIDDGVQIGPGAYIRKGAIISKHCEIGHTAEVKNALLMEGCKLSNHTFVGDSILGIRARVGGHSETTNRRFDQSEISWLDYNGDKYQTYLKKLGCILGEDSRLGGGTFTAPGITIGRNSFISSGVTLNKSVGSEKFVKITNAYDIIDNQIIKKLQQ